VLSKRSRTVSTVSAIAAPSPHAVQADAGRNFHPAAANEIGFAKAARSQGGFCISGQFLRPHG
jgi:hypothetical protein